jgi:hypothetical protein
MVTEPQVLVFARMDDVVRVREQIHFVPTGFFNAFDMHDITGTRLAHVLLLAIESSGYSTSTEV